MTVAAHLVDLEGLVLLVISTDCSHFDYLKDEIGHLSQLNFLSEPCLLECRYLMHFYWLDVQRLYELHF